MDARGAPSSPNEVPVCSCEHCSAPLPLDAIAQGTVVRCTHCRGKTRISDDLRERARAHTAAIREKWAQTLKAEQAELLARSTRRAGLFLGCMVFSTMMTLLALIFTKEPAPHAASVRLVVITLVAYAATGLVAGRTFKVPTAAMALASGFGACSSCGAPVRFKEGAAAASCTHCRASCIVNREIKAQMFAAAAERLGLNVSRLRLQEAGLDKHTDRVALVATFAILIAVVAAWMFVLWGSSEGPPQPTEWALPTVGAALLALMWWGIRGAKRRFAQQIAFDNLVRSLRSGERPEPPSTSR